MEEIIDLHRELQNDLKKSKILKIFQNRQKKSKKCAYIEVRKQTAGEPGRKGK